MGILSFFRQHRIAPAWKYQAPGTIWRLHVAAHGRIVGEVRHEAERRASFFCVDGSTGKALWENLELAEPWWVGIETVHRNVVVFHRFAKPSMPGHRAILAHDLETGTSLWRNDDLTFQFASGDYLFASNEGLERCTLCKLALSSGEVVEEYDAENSDLHLLKGEVDAKEELEGMLFPQVYDPSAVDIDVRDAIRRVTARRELVGNVELARKDNHIVMSFYSPAAATPMAYPSLENHLLVLDLERGTTVFDEILTAAAKVPVPDCFFIKQGTVYFIKDQSILTALSLE